MNKCKFDVIIPVAPKDATFVPRVVDFVCRCFENVECIYILTAKTNFTKIRRRIPINAPCILIDENELLPGLSLLAISDILKECCPNGKFSAGWYFQQFLKLGFAQSKYCKDYYLSWDADTLPLAHISFFENEHLLFNPKAEYNPNYFKTIKRLFGYGKQTEYSFIAESMIFSRNIVCEMLVEIEKNELDGITWFKKILYASDLDNLMPAFSEFETYGTYCSVNYPDLYKPRHLNTFREAGYICGRNISENKLRMMSFDLDIASFETGHLPMFPYNLLPLIINNRKLTFNQIMKKIWTKLRKKNEDLQISLEQLLRLPQRHD